LLKKIESDPEYGIFYATDSNKDDKLSLDEWKAKAKELIPNYDD